jgi:hypothetical protein
MNYRNNQKYKAVKELYEDQESDTSRLSSQYQCMPD